MTKHLSIVLASSLVISSQIGAEPPAEPRNSEIAPLIRKLSHPDFQTREDASKEIWQFGVDAVPYLEDASKSKDPEVAARAEVLIRNIAAGILPNTPPEIAELIDKYSQNNVNGKLAILRELSDKRAYKQMLHMLSWEKNNAHRDLLLRDFRNIGLLAARQAILKNDLNEAIELLKLSPREENTLRALAFLLKRTGKIDDEIARIQKFKANENIDEWLKILLQIKGDKKLLKQFAENRGDADVLSTVAVLDGDPVPAFDLIEGQLKDSASLSGLKMIRSTVLNQGDPKKAEKKADKLAQAILDAAQSTQNEREMEPALRSLFTGGYQDMAGELFSRYDDTQYSQYLDAYERPTQALEVMGIPSAKDAPKEYYDWVKDSVKRSITEDQDSESGHQARILEAAIFYFSRGEVEIARSTLKELLIVLEKEGLDRWHEVVRSLPEAGMSEMAVEFILERGNANNDLDNMVNALYGDTLAINRIWKSLRDRENTIEKDFVDMSILMGMYRSKLAEGKKLEAYVLEKAKKSGRNAYIDMLFSLAEAATVRNDLAGSLDYYRVISKLGKEVADRGDWRSHYRELAEGLQSWKDYISAYELQENNLRELPVEMAKYAISLKKVGRNRDGDEQLEKAVTMTLSIPTEYNEIALLLYGAGYKDQAMQMWEDTLIGFKPTDWEFHYTLQYMGLLSRYHILKGDWKMASTVASVEAALSLKNLSRDFSPAYSLRSGFYAFFTSGMLDYHSNRKEVAIWKLQKAHQMGIGDGLLADEFYPSMRNTSLAKEYDAWFGDAYVFLEKVLQKYPNAHNTHNTIAWLGSRAVRNLDGSLTHAQKAVELAPKQGAYLDTLAEVYFARRDRRSAVKWSQAAVQSVSDGSMAYQRAQDTVYKSHIDLTDQMKRFKTEEFPSAEVKPSTKRN
ncbi:hypothetical protein Rhal01_00416 [Rubritalea halochordaticola]|uniref:Tetratricopeptide repeat protein n=1 Tax=Rubritalea halochordaticola TaxID=714537 RepID=A0ABP9V0W1_9BACT